MTDWVSMSEKLHSLAEEQLFPITDDWMIAYKTAWQVVLNNLSEKTWDSQPTDPAEFELIVDDQSIPLSKDNIIPNGFWYHYREAEIRQPSMPTLADEADCYAGLNGWGYRFKDGAVRGEVGKVLVRTPANEQTTEQAHSRGRPKGTGHQQADRPIVERALAYRDAMGVSDHAAAEQFADQMPGGGHFTSKLRRLRDTMKGHRSLD